MVGTSFIITRGDGFFIRFGVGATATDLGVETAAGVLTGIGPDLTFAELGLAGVLTSIDLGVENFSAGV